MVGLAVELVLNQRQICDLELILNGGFAPLTGFLGQADYESVVSAMRLANGQLWPMPIVLDVSEAYADRLALGTTVELRDPEGLHLANLSVAEIWRPDRAVEARSVYGTEDQEHPGVAHLLQKTHPVYISGQLEKVALPHHYDFRHLRDTPAELKAKFEKLGWKRIVAFQTRNPMHRAHLELTFRAAKNCEANLLLHPVVGMTKPNDVDHYTRVRCYEHVLKHFPEQTTMLSLLPLAMRMAGPREALWHALIRKNYGATHFIIGRDHAGPGKDKQGNNFYDPYAAQELVARHTDEIGIEAVTFREMVYVQDLDQYVQEHEVSPGQTVQSISGSELRRRLQEGLEIPAWFTYPQIEAELRKTYPPKHKQGFTVLFTGLSGAGKSTLANALMIKLMQQGGRSVTLLDGDVVRKQLSSELGFSREHRNLNVLRIGFVASEITKAGGIAICAPIAPYAATRKQVREQVSQYGGYLEVFVSTPIEICEKRDRKGLYAKARKGEIKEFTGVSDPYETPEEPDIHIDTRDIGVDEAIQLVWVKLVSKGYLH